MSIFHLLLLPLLTFASENFEPKQEVGYEKIFREFRCGPSLVSPYISEKGYVRHSRLEYGELVIRREDIGIAARTQVEWKNKLACDIAFKDHTNIYFSSGEQKLLLETRSPVGIYISAYDLKNNCAPLGWANVTTQQGAVGHFLNGDNSCNLLHDFNCADATAMVQNLIHLDLAGDRLKAISEIDDKYDFEKVMHKHYDHAVMVLDSKVTNCESAADGFWVTLHHEIYGTLMGTASLEVLRNIEKKTLHSETVRLKIQQRGEDYRVNFDNSYPPHVSLKQMRTKLKYGN